MAIGGVVINFTARTRDAVREVGKLTNELRDVDKKAGRAGGALKSGLQKGALGAVAAVGALGGVLWEAGKAAQEDWQQSEKLADTLGTIPGITQAMIDANEEWITSTQLATNVLDTDLRNAVGKAALAVGDLGEAQRIAAAAADLAVLVNKDYSTVAEAMIKAAAGNTTQLEKMAPWLDTNKDGTLKLSEALGELEGKHRDAAEQVADRDPFTRFQIVLDELQETLGTALLPYLQDFSSWLGSEEGRAALRDWGNAAGQTAKLFGQLASALAAVAREWNRLPAWARGERGSAGRPYGNIWGPLGTPGTSRPSGTGRGAVSGRPYAPANSSVTVNNYYPKPERASESTAMSLRIARNAVL